MLQFLQLHSPSARPNKVWQSCLQGKFEEQLLKNFLEESQKWKKPRDWCFHVTLWRFTRTHLSTNMPAWTAWTMLRKRGFSSLRRSIRPIWRVKVEASQSRTSEGTDSDWMSLSSSSVSTRRLERWEEGRGAKWKTRWVKRQWQMLGVKNDKIFIVDLRGIKSKSQKSPSNNITSYVTSKYLRPLKQHVGSILKSNSGYNSPQPPCCVDRGSRAELNTHSYGIEKDLHHGHNQDTMWTLWMVHYPVSWSGHTGAGPNLWGGGCLNEERFI